MAKYTFEMLPLLLEKIEVRLERIESLIQTARSKDLTDDYLSAKRAADMLNFTLATLYTKVCKGEIPSYKKGNRLYFSLVEIKDWIERGKKTSIDQIEQKAFIIANKIEKKGR
ncbi:helix-turn-helix domain-containing protein [Chryseobacterium sediminis]|uniref:helix-turn-helix domain-containing protein n=1 Tax=Chryseobacterium sediminis TaxID=1679494 RepID=UPI00285BDD99|nr:helix-turn-helix domain-containing protein [Chryseobacterium sediminis]MDR6464606.1 excisionase family DNA binding protein [Chryseobacterium sediminis]